MVSTEKSHFLHKLEDLLPGDPKTSIEVCDALLVDGNAVIHILPVTSDVEKPTFKIMADRFMQYVKHKSDHISSGEVKQIHIVFDRYIEGSIKTMTREKRGSQFIHKSHHV